MTKIEWHNPEPSLEEKREFVALQKLHASSGISSIPGKLSELRKIYRFSSLRGEKLKEWLNELVEDAKKDYALSLKLYPTKREFRKVTREKGITHVPEILSPEVRKRIEEMIAKKL